MQTRLSPPDLKTVKDAQALTGLSDALFMKRAMLELADAVLEIHRSYPKLLPNELTAKVFEVAEKMKELRKTLLPKQ